ncbi:hypothetical protein DMENIID0001_152880 [Sergentomyia squamirostris]
MISISECTGKNTEYMMKRNCDDSTTMEGNAECEGKVRFSGRKFILTSGIMPLVGVHRLELPQTPLSTPDFPSASRRRRVPSQRVLWTHK